MLVGINLLREGLDLPEVSLVAILDADKEGFLRSPRSLIQTIGRAARNVNGARHHVRRHDHRGDEARDRRDRPAPRASRQAYNKEHGIMPATIMRAVMNINPAAGTTDYIEIPKVPKSGKTAKGGARARSTSPSRFARSAPRCSAPPRTSTSSAPRGCATS